MANLSSEELARRKAMEADSRSQLKGLLAGFSDPGGMVSGYLGDTPGTQRIKGDKAASPNAAFVGDLLNPMSMLPMIKDAGMGLYEAGRDLLSGGEEAPKLMSRDDFMKERRVKRETLEEASKRAETEFMNSDAYKSMVASKMVTKAKEALTAAGERARKTWREGQGTVGAEEAKLEDDYKRYAEGFDTQLEAFHGRDFADRNPGLAKALPLVGTAAAGLLTRGMFNKIAKTGKGYVDDAEEALKDGRMGDFATAQGKVADWQARAGKQKAAAVAAGATVPLDIRAAGDLQDKYGLSREYQDSQGEWQRGRAQQTAEDKLGDPLHYMVDGIPALISGGIGAGIGAKFANRTPDIEAKAVTDLLTNTSAKTLDPLLEARARLTQANRGPTELPQFQPARPQALESGSSGQQGMGLLDETMAPPLQPVNALPAQQLQTQTRGIQPTNPQQAGSSAAPTDLLSSEQMTGQGSATSVVGGQGPSIPRKPRATQADRDLLAGDIAKSYQPGQPLNIEQLVNGSNLSPKQAGEVLKNMQPILDAPIPQDIKMSMINKILSDTKTKFAIPGAMAGAGAADLMTDPSQSGGY